MCRGCMYSNMNMHSVCILTAKCIDEYIRLSVKASETIEESPALDPRLLDIVERMLDK
jgi:hypothetical protein